MRMCCFLFVHVCLFAVCALLVACEVAAYDCYQSAFAGGAAPSWGGAQGCPGASAGERFRRSILEPAATVAGADMLRAFLGREPSLDAFVAALVPKKLAAAK